MEQGFADPVTAISIAAGAITMLRNVVGLAADVKGFFNVALTITSNDINVPREFVVNSIASAFDDNADSTNYKVLDATRPIIDADAHMELAKKLDGLAIARWRARSQSESQKAAWDELDRAFQDIGTLWGSDSTKILQGERLKNILAQESTYILDLRLISASGALVLKKGFFTSGIGAWTSASVTYSLYRNDQSLIVSGNSMKDLKEEFTR